MGHGKRLASGDWAGGLAAFGRHLEGLASNPGKKLDVFIMMM